MINSLYSNTPALLSVHVSNNTAYVGNYGAACGTMRYNNGNIEVYDGSIWHIISASASVTLQPDTVEAIEWAKKKVQEEKEILLLAEEYPLVKDLKEQLDIAIALVKNETRQSHS